VPDSLGVKCELRDVIYSLLSTPELVIYSKDRAFFLMD